MKKIYKHHALLILGLLAFTALPPQHLNAQQVNNYFEKIRNNPPMLTAFMTAMPKGGDLHHHFSGSMYGETYWEILDKNNGWMNPVDIAVDIPGTLHNSPWERFETLRSRKDLDSLKQAFLHKTSIKDYTSLAEPGDQHFFATFGYYSAVATYGMIQGLQEFKRRAISENVSYIETIVGAPDTLLNLEKGPIWESTLAGAALSDSTAVSDTLNMVFNALSSSVSGIAINFCKKQRRLHQQAAIDDSSFTLRYQLSASRSAAPLAVYRRLLIAFQAASLDTEMIVGVNLVSPEDGAVSMRDYTLHMLMIAHLHQKFKNIRYSLHAGELTTGMVRPELLRYHIQQAVTIAGASRIGHGVDIAHEAQAIQLLHYMRIHKIAVEINLGSNEFILQVKNEQHPVMMYYTHKVPIVISTDDAAVLRTDLTQQYILLASRYPSLSYTEIKAIARNSITYSFMTTVLKEQKLQQLDKAFEQFERSIVAEFK
jgi:hypothetical protein